MSSNIPKFSGTSRPPAKWAELEEKYKQDIEALTESAEMAAIDKELAEEKLDGCEKELAEVKDKLSEALLMIDQLKNEKSAEQSAGSNESTVTVLQLRKVEEQNEVLKQALIKVRDISTSDKKEIEDLRIEREELQLKLLDAEEKDHKYTEQIKILEEQVDVCQSAQEMVEKLSQQKGELEDKLRDMIEDLDSMEKLRDLNEQLLDSARENEIELTSQLDKLRVQCSELLKHKRDIEDYLTDQERTVTKLKDENRVLSEQVNRLNDRFKETESIEQQKHQIENVAYKLNFSESKMAEKEAEIARCRRNLAELEEQMNNMSSITKEQSARLDDLKAQYDSKTSENAELQRALKRKMEEVSELEIRRDMAEKKLQSVQKDKEMKIAELTRKIDTMKGIEIQHGEEMKHLLEDKELIDRERRELRDQLNRSNRSLERSMQTAGNLSMVTAQDVSLASLGISFHSTPSVQPSPVAKATAISASTGAAGTQLQPTSVIPTESPISSSANMQPGLKINDPVEIIQSRTNAGAIPSSLNTTRRQLFIGSQDKDNGFLSSRIDELSIAFDQMAHKNYELELELAYREIGSKPQPYNGSATDSYSSSTFDHQGYISAASNANSLYDMDRARNLRQEMGRLKREIRASIINQQICTKARNINAHIREQRFNMTRLAMRCQALECETNSLLSNTSLSRLEALSKATHASARNTLGGAPLLQSTPVK